MKRLNGLKYVLLLGILLLFGGCGREGEAGSIAKKMPRKRSISETITLMSMLLSERTQQHAGQEMSCRVIFREPAETCCLWCRNRGRRSMLLRLR